MTGWGDFMEAEAKRERLRLDTRDRSKRSSGVFERALAETSSDNEPKMVHFGDHLS